MPNQINHALVETTRPPMYKAVKYWGKKPHNIWAEFIECYCPEGGIVLDPFAGSGIAAFESVIQNRKVISFDINPMSSFFIEVNTCTFSFEDFEKVAQEIINIVSSDLIYKEHYISQTNGEEITIFNYIWKEGTVWKVNAKAGFKLNAKAKKKKEKPFSFFASDVDKLRCQAQENITIPYWYPEDKFPNTPVISSTFIRDIGGDNYSCLWTRRNLYILSMLFDLIQKQPKELHLPLLYAFVHTLHLVSKMVVARQEKGNRSFSGSWGRADYMIRNRIMEQNPLVIFTRACFGKQGVIASLKDAKSRIPESLKIHHVKRGYPYKRTANINYGQIDVVDLMDYIKEKSIDFVITDPPYGGLVQYMDLSLIWLVWLQKYNEKYTPDSSAEITVKKGIVERDLYRRRLRKAFENIYRVLKDDGYLVVTFHNKEMKEWNDFVNSLRGAGFIFDKVIHQYNRRSGESNVSNPYGTAGSDFYIRCVKYRGIDFTDETTTLPLFVRDQTIKLLAERGEPTPYEFIQNGVLPELLQAGYLQPNEPAQALQTILANYVGPEKIFKVTQEKTNTGDLWWFNNPQEHINYPDIPLSSRVEEAVLALLRRKISVKLDDVIAELFKMYPNGLTPDPRNIINVLKKYAIPSAEKWKLKQEVCTEVTRHTEIIEKLCEIGSCLLYGTFVGKREQHEKTSKGLALREVCSQSNLSCLKTSYSNQRLERLSMIDCIFLEENTIKYIFEVENSTNFSDAIIRASNAEEGIRKIMVIPDARESELLHYSDPLFYNSFIRQNWMYILYSELEHIASLKEFDLDIFEKNSHNLKELS